MEKIDSDYDLDADLNEFQLCNVREPGYSSFK